MQLFFESKEFFLDFNSRGGDLPEIRINGFVEKGNEFVKASIKLHKTQESIAKAFEADFLFDSEVYLKSIAYMKNLNKLITEKNAVGVVKVWEKTDFLEKEFVSINLLISDVVYREIYQKISSPLPTCLISANCGEVDDLWMLKDVSRAVLSYDFCLKYV